jgi:enamine deaminase RidA (YjgF/YER057c/UK114 family)
MCANRKKEMNMERAIIDTDKTPKASGPFSKAVKITDPSSLIFVSGHAVPPQGREDLRDNAKAQTKEIFEKIKHVLEAGGRISKTSSK